MVVFICTFIIYFLIYFTGSCIFSFLNVIVYRVPKKQSFIKGFSYCPTCGHRLGPADLIPVFSYIGLGGKCRYCKTGIGARDTFVELAGGAIAILCWVYGKTPEKAIVLFLFYAILTVVTLMDWDTMEIADGCSVAMLVLGIASYMILNEISLTQCLIGVIIVSIPMLVIALIIPGAFGGGDIKLMAASGMFLGWKLTLVSTILGLITGAVYAIYLMIYKKESRKAHFPFGPFLCIGMGIAVLYGNDIIDWYLRAMLG